MSAAMGVQLEPLNQGLSEYGPWHFHDIRFQQDQRAELEAALLQTASIPGLNDTLREISRAGRREASSGSTHRDAIIPEVVLSVSKTASRPPSPGPSTGHISPPAETWPSTPPTTPTTPVKSYLPVLPDAPNPYWTFRHLSVPEGPILTFPLERACEPVIRPSLKRRRPDTDVDGPNTASLSCKKRRLLRNLVTSRLSQPFSLPATHIVNRESAATGDKRFAKLAAMMAARRMVTTTLGQQQQMQQPSPSTWLRRAAVLNRLRQRVCAEAAERGGILATADLAAKAAAFRQQGQATATIVGGRYLVQDATPNRLAPGSAVRPATGLPQPTAIPVVVSPVPCSNARPIHPLTTNPSPSSSAQISKQTPPPPPTGPTARLRIPSPQLRPLRSPELRVTRPLVPLELEDLSKLDEGSVQIPACPPSDDTDDDGVAFPTSEHESRYMHDDEEEVGVYADFSVIFGGGGNDIEEEEGEGGDGEHVEDYMDDLDGIPWCARC